MLSGPADGSISLISKLQIKNMQADIMNLTLTSRSKEGEIEVAVSAEDGLRFVTIRFEKLGRQLKFVISH